VGLRLTDDPDRHCSVQTALQVHDVASPGYQRPAVPGPDRARPYRTAAGRGRHG
jgi:hypothetical protein